MSKYRLINRKTNEETICDKVEIDGFEYYVNEEPKDKVDFYYTEFQGKRICKNQGDTAIERVSNRYKRVIATNNPSIDCFKVIDEVANGKEIKELAKLSFQEETYIEDFNSLNGKKHFLGFAKGYNKAKEQFKWTDADTISFIEWCAINYVPTSKSGEVQFWQKDTYQNKEHYYSTKELLQLWQESNPKVIYYD